ncbi:hypothetical protein T492DRAFT_886620 [Pavlovales sp. CCMP2436]|nr:hypothetical protein T492DRAFT_886620 [Pavlovales sp. CCMP2436]
MEELYSWLASEAADAEPFTLLDADSAPAPPAPACAAGAATAGAGGLRLAETGDGGAVDAEALSVGHDGSGGAQRWPALPFALHGNATPRDAPESVVLVAAPRGLARTAMLPPVGAALGAPGAAGGSASSAEHGPLGAALAERALKEALLLMLTEAGFACASESGAQTPQAAARKHPPA